MTRKIPLEFLVLICVGLRYVFDIFIEYFKTDIDSTP